jgi:DNA polymerase-3 subunit beta
MKFQIEREKLLKPLQIVSSVVERRQQSPILSNTLVQVNKGELTLTGTDLEVEMVAHCSLEDGDDGEITLPARKLLDVCRSLPEGAKIELDMSGDRAQIRSGRSRFTLTTLPAVEYPAMDAIADPIRLSLSQTDLKFLIDQTHFAMAQQDVRYYLNGMLLEIQPQQLRAVATDGHRLALCQVETDVAVDTPVKVIVPRKGVQELQRLLEDTTAGVEIQVGKNQIKVQIDDVVFTSKLIDGKFPDYEQVIPKQTERELRSNREQLRQAFSRIAVLSNEKFRGMRLELEENSLKATVHNPEQEEAEEELEVTYAGEPIEIGFNISYFLDALSAVRSEDVNVFFTDSNHSCVIKGAGDEQSQYVIMPMRL